MPFVVRRLAVLTGVLGVFAVLGVWIIGCSGVSPFTAAQFATKITTIQGGGGPTPPPANGDDDGENTVTRSVCDLDTELRGIQITLANLSQQYVKFSLTLAVSAGSGGFVCDDELQNYTRAGYSDAQLVGNTTTIGCDTLTLLSGTRLLVLEFGINQLTATLPPATGDATNPTPSVLQLTRRDTGSPLLPLPELIVLGNGDQNFICSGNQLCTQRGFVYYSAPNGLPLGKAVDASRIQGTVCNRGFGTAPEWRLDKTLKDGLVQSFQYVAGGAIVATVLDRAGDAPNLTRNQVVWQVTDSAGNTVHFPQP